MHVEYERAKGVENVIKQDAERDMKSFSRVVRRQSTSIQQMSQEIFLFDPSLGSPAFFSPPKVRSDYVRHFAVLCFGFNSVYSSELTNSIASTLRSVAQRRAALRCFAGNLFMQIVCK